MSWQRSSTPPLQSASANCRYWRETPGRRQSLTSHCRHLHAAGHDALHVADVDLLTAADLAIAEFAATDERVVVTSDSDFGSILARTGARVPSLVLFRHHNGATPDRQLELIEAALAAAADDLDHGAIVTISRGRLRVRRLPIS